MLHAYGTRKRNGVHVSVRWLFTLFGAAALLAGTGLWMAKRPASVPSSPEKAMIEIAPGALLAASFIDASGQSQTLARFPARILVVNFWATWCAPCREEMPAFSRLQARWADRGVQFVGLANESADKVQPFGKSLQINYPLWTGGEEVSELSRRLGNKRRVLPYTAIIDSSGRVLETKVGPYTEGELEQRLSAYAANTQQLR